MGPYRPPLGFFLRIMWFTKLGAMGSDIWETTIATVCMDWREI